MDNLWMIINISTIIINFVFFIVLINTISDVRQIKKKLNMNQKDNNEAERLRLEIAYKRGIITEDEFNKRQQELKHENV